MKIALSAVVLLVACSVSATGENKNYSGSYSQTGPKPQRPVLLQVKQDETAIELRRESDGKTVVTHVPLNGYPVECTTPGGVSGKCRAEFAGSDLIIESNVFTQVGTKTQIVRMHSKQTWHLSPDGKTLIIKNQVDSPQISPEILQSVAPDNPWTEIYQRVQ